MWQWCSQKECRIGYTDTLYEKHHKRNLMALPMHCVDSPLLGVSHLLEAKIVLWMGNVFSDFWQMEKQDKKNLPGPGFFRSINHLHSSSDIFSSLENQAEIFNVKLAVINTPCEFFLFEISSLNDFHSIPLGDVRIQLELPSIGNNFLLLLLFWSYNPCSMCNLIIIYL